VLMTETNTEAMRLRVLRAAKYRLGAGKYQADFEHGQWWVTKLSTGAQWSVVDCEGPAPGRGFSGRTKTITYLDFEQVTHGEDN
jgi:hypothetical protein